LFFCALGSAEGRADPIDVTVGLTADALSASHSINGSPATLDVPLPMLTGNARYHAFEVQAQYLPGLPISLYNGGQLTNLSILLATARLRLGDHFMVGVGSTLLNQVSSFLPFTNSAAFIDQSTERSRVVGARYVVGYADRHSGFSLVAGVTPRMHGRVHDECIETSTFFGTTPCYHISLFTVSEDAAENATEVDAELRVWRPLGRRAEWMYGWRYLNFVGSVFYPRHLDTDQNRGTGPSVGVRWHI
jgi:hypothetical protein